MRIWFPFVRTVLFSCVVSLASLHGQTWTLSRTNIPEVTQATAIAYGNGRFVALVSGTATAPHIVWSSDGTVWHGVNSGFAGTDIRFLAGSFYVTAGTFLFRSADGETWQAILSNTRGNLGAMTTDGRGLMIQLDSTTSLKLLYSPDRITFTETGVLPNTNPPNVRALHEGVAYANGHYFTEADVVQPGGLTARTEFAVSTDNGATWTTTTAISGATYLCSGGGRLVAGGGFGGFSGGITGNISRTTTDGVNFITGTGPFSIINGGTMGYAGGRFFFLGTFYTSTDGATWAILGTPPAGASRQLRSIAYGNGKYVAVGYDISNGQSLDVIATLVTPAAPIIATMAADRTAAEGSSTTFSVSVENPATGVSYQWRRDGVVIPGATAASYTLAMVRPADAGRYTVDLRNSIGTTLSDVAYLTVSPPTPSIIVAPASLSVVAGQAAELTVVAGGASPFTYQWFRDGTAVAGATAATLKFDNPLVTDAGAYTVTITNVGGSVTSAAAALSVTPVSRISNLSILTALASNTETFTLGYVVGGSSTGAMTKNVVVRAVGPSLTALGVTGVLDDPKLETYAGAIKTGENDNWGGLPALATAFTNVGAFPFGSATSRDAALATTLNSRDNSVRISGVGSGGGRVLAEVYDATADASFSLVSPRLLNVSVLKLVGAGFTAGFTLSGSSAKMVLIRAVGPTLRDFGVGDAITDPQLVLFNSSSGEIGANNDWGGTAALTAAFASVGAFALPASSRDAALLTTLAPGGYTVQVTAVGSATGVVLFEIYEVP